MTIQDLLTKDFRKNILPEVIRFMSIFGNIIIFFYFSGWVDLSWKERKIRYGPQIFKADNIKDMFFYETIEDRTIKPTGPDDRYYDLSEDHIVSQINCLNMITLLAAVLLTIKQLTFTRPEINSFHEKIYLLAQEKVTAGLLVLLSLFKFFYQLWERHSPKVKFYTYSAVDIYNLILILSSITCFYSSISFRYEMRMAEKRMTLKIVSFFKHLSFVFFIMFLIYVTFLNENHCIFLAYLIVILFDLFRIVKMIFHQKKSKALEIRDFVVSIKWISFTMVALIVTGPLIYSSVRNYYLPKDPTKIKVVDAANRVDGIRWFFIMLNYLSLYIQGNPNKNNWIISDMRLLTLTSIYGLLFSVCALEYFASVEAGASLDLFDIHLTDKFDMNEKKDHEEKEDLVSTKSHMYNYFMNKVFSILGMTEDQIFNGTYNLKPQFARELQQGSPNLNNKLESFKTKYINTLKKKNQRIIANVFLFLKWVNIV